MTNHNMVVTYIQIQDHCIHVYVSVATIDTRNTGKYGKELGIENEQYFQCAVLFQLIFCYSLVY